MTDAAYNFAYVQERWHALAGILPPEQHAMAWKVYSGGVSVGLSFAIGDNDQEFHALIQWLGSTKPPQVQ